MARPELTCVLHAHTPAVNGVGATVEGLLPLTQKALLLLPFLGYHDFEGTAGLDERERIVHDLGEDGRIVILRNHGSLAVGRSVSEAWVWQYRLETACRNQIEALTCVAAGLTMNRLSDETVAKTMEQGRKALSPGGFFPVGTTEWPSLVTKLERERGTAYRA